MDQALTKTKFDELDRQRIRAQLFAEMERYKFRVPTLCKKIADGTGRSVDLIPQKTLQRFLAGNMRTNDAFLRICDQFVRSLAAVDETADVLPLLTNYFRPGPPVPEAGLSPPMTAALIGSYQVDAIVKTGGHARLGDFAIAPLVGTTTLRVRERVLNPLVLVKKFGDDEEQPHHNYDGVLLSFETYSVALLRHSTSRRPRIHWLITGPDNNLHSDCTEAHLRQDTARLTPIIRSILQMRKVTVEMD